MSACPPVGSTSVPKVSASNGSLKTRRTTSALVGGSIPQAALTLFHLLASEQHISVPAFQVDSVVTGEDQLPVVETAMAWRPVFRCQPGHKIRFGLGAFFK